MATRETPRLRRTVVYVAQECEEASPGSTAPLLRDYQALLASDSNEADIVTALLGIVVMLADSDTTATATANALSRMRQG